MHKNRAKRGICIVISLSVVAVAGGLYLFYYGNSLSTPDGKPVFVGDSSELQASEVLPTLDTPIPADKNAIWCASFLSAWKTLEADLAKEPVALQGSPAVAMALNKAADPRPHIPKQCLYVAAGWNQKGIIDQINSDLAKKFPAKAPPTFPGIASDSFVAYAYLEADMKFSIPYFQNREALVFTDHSGKKTELNSFGIRPEDDYAYFELRRQPEILLGASNEEFERMEYVIDLDRTSQPNQIVLALMEPKPTLAEMLAAVKDIIEKQGKKKTYGLGPRDVLLVPDIVWRITHRFAELEGQEFTNATLKGQRLDVAQQDIQFSLDRSGAELKSEAKLFCTPIPTYYVFDRPFLLYMKKRGAEMPYFVMWIENAELLNKWTSSWADRNPRKEKGE